jgi:sarcosine oxidase, subunit gamma
MIDAVLDSPLIVLGTAPRRELSVDCRTCLLAEIPFMDIVNLRGDPSDARFVQAVRAATSLDLPVQANTAAVQGARQLIWLGPDEWLLKDAGAGSTAADGLVSPLANALRATLAQHAGLHYAAVETGSAHTTFTLQGPASADLLARGCPLDLHPRAFANGALAQSHIARAPALIRCVQPGQSYEITVRRSFAPYLFQWLCAAGD